MDFEQADFSVTGGMCLYLLHATSPAAQSWAQRQLDQGLSPGHSIRVEHRFIGDICRAILRDGLTVSLDGQAYYENEDGELVALEG